MYAFINNHLEEEIVILKNQNLVYKGQLISAKSFYFYFF